jgi:hypothetical protein
VNAAVISDNGLHRYLLTRELGGTSTCTWIMLNPSTADADVDDPTIRRCVAFTKAWGYGRLEVVNLFAYRATNPKELAEAASAGINAVGEDNDEHIIGSALAADRVVAAWGAHPYAATRGARVRWLLSGVRDRTCCLGRTKTGYPRHPLYVKGDTIPGDYL